MVQNAEDGGNRRFILIQLPEPLPVEEPAVKTIADLGKYRLRLRKSLRPQMKASSFSIHGVTRDLGFKLMKLDRSNFKLWEGDPTIEEGLARQIEMHVDHLSRARGSEDVLYELLLKVGFPITTKISIREMAGKTVFSIEDNSLLICLEKEITPELIDAIAEANPLQVICLDEAFKGNDQLKANAVQTFRARAEAEESEIVFRTV